MNKDQSVETINFEVTINELKKLAKIVESDEIVKKPPTTLVGLIGELLVLQKLIELRFNPRYISRQSRPDIIVDGKRIEVKSSHVNYDRRLKGYQSGNANINVDKFDVLVLVSISRDWNEEKFFVLNKEDVYSVKLDKRSFGDKSNYVEIRYCEEPITTEQKHRNKQMEKFLNKWDKIQI